MKSIHKFLIESIISQNEIDQNNSNTKDFLKKFSEYLSKTDPDGKKYFDKYIFNEFYRYNLKNVIIDNLEKITAPSAGEDKYGFNILLINVKNSGNVNLKTLEPSDVNWIACGLTTIDDKALDISVAYPRYKAKHGEWDIESCIDSFERQSSVDVNKVAKNIFNHFTNEYDFVTTGPSTLAIVYTDENI